MHQQFEDLKSPFLYLLIKIKADYFVNCIKEYDLNISKKVQSCTVNIKISA